MLNEYRPTYVKEPPSEDNKRYLEKEKLVQRLKQGYKQSAECCSECGQEILVKYSDDTPPHVGSWFCTSYDCRFFTGTNWLKANNEKLPLAKPNLRLWKKYGLPFCQWCLRTKQEIGFIGFHIHHIQSRQGGGSDDPSNLMTLCRYCHEQVHLERKKFGTDER